MERKPLVEEPKYIKIKDMKTGYLYRVSARNAQFGIWIGVGEKAFILSRFKFGDNFLDKEYHWDTGAPYGTVRPWEEIEKSPFTFTSLGESGKLVRAYLNLVKEEYEEGQNKSSI